MSAAEQNKVTNLEELLDRIKEAASQNSQVSFDNIFELIGSRSYGPLLLLAGLITLAPIIGDIPSVPTIIAVLVFMISIQLLLHRQNFWLPQFVTKRSIDCKKVMKSLDWLYPPARYIDRVLRPRLLKLTSKPMVHGAALIALSISLIMPVLEFVPFSANFAGAALTAYGIAIITHDGVVAIIAYLFTAGIIGFTIYSLL